MFVAQLSDTSLRLLTASAMAVEPAVVKTLDQMLRLFSTAIALSLVIAIITLALMQILYPFVRGLAQSVQMASWLSTLSDEHDSSEPTVRLPDWLIKEVGPTTQFVVDGIGRPAKRKVFPGPDALNLLRSVTNGHLMKCVQDASNQLLARPSMSAGEYRFITRGAAEIDRETILFLDFLTLNHPRRVAALLDVRPVQNVASSAERHSDGSGIAEAVAAAQHSVTSAAERRLDEFQLKLDGALASTSRVVCVMIGLTIAWTAADALHASERGAVTIVGIVGGLLGGLFLELLGSFLGRRR